MHFEILMRRLEATGLQITGADSLNMNASKTLQLEAVYTPEGAAGAGVDWSVDKEEVATIDANGLLTAVKAGTVVVTATDKENEKLTATKDNHNHKRSDNCKI